ncbi:MAG: hypothetical protein ACFE0I_02560 [Elainellaceae cyanobacterium]
MKLANINPVSNADWLITIEGLGDTYWSTFSGLEKTINRPKFSDGQTAHNRTAATGRSEYSDVTISKVHDPEKDDPVIQWILDHEDGTEFDCTARAVKRGRTLEFRGRKAIKMSKCKIASYRIPGSVDTSDGSNTATLEISFSVDQSAYN